MCVWGVGWGVGGSAYGSPARTPGPARIPALLGAWIVREAYQLHQLPGVVHLLPLALPLAQRLVKVLGAAHDVCLEGGCGRRARGEGEHPAGMAARSARERKQGTRS